MEIYQVGGAVRDELLGLAVKDRDWVVIGATPDDMLDLGYRPVGSDFPVFLHPETGEEYALGRTERKTAPGYKGFQFNTSPDVTLEQDLKRRDITINAIARDDQGNFIDPFNGQQDLKDRVIRHISPAFIEDPLRVLRVARFAARFGFTIATETQELLTELSNSGELEALVPERVWVETEKALQTQQPGLYFSTLRNCNALAIIYPEIDNLFGIPQPEKYHPEIDSGVHTMMVLDMATRLSADPIVRFAALVHDLGKATTPKEQLPSHPGHEERSVDLIKDMATRMRIPNRYCELAIIVARHHLECHRIKEMRAATILSKLEAIDAFRRPERFTLFLLACEADARGRAGLEESSYTQADFFQTCFTAANAVDTKNITEQNLSGEQMGEAIRNSRVAAIQNVLDNADT